MSSCRHMALVPYRVSGAAADQGTETRVFQIGGSTITIHQQAGGSLRSDPDRGEDVLLERRTGSPTRGGRSCACLMCHTQQQLQSDNVPTCHCRPNAIAAQLQPTCPLVLQHPFCKTARGLIRELLRLGSSRRLPPNLDPEARY